MISFFKSVQSVVQQLVGELPEGVRILTEFLWKSRWFLVSGFLLYMVYNVVMTALPFIMWSFAIRTVVGTVFSLFIGV